MSKKKKITPVEEDLANKKKNLFSIDGKEEEVNFSVPGDPESGVESMHENDGSVNDGVELNVPNETEINSEGLAQKRVAVIIDKQDQEVKVVEENQGIDESEEEIVEGGRDYVDCSNTPKITPVGCPDISKSVLNELTKDEGEKDFQPYSNSVDNYHSRMAKVQFGVGVLFGVIATIVLMALIK